MCFGKIVDLILKSNLPQEECDNYYSGYERLMNQVMSKFEKAKAKSSTFMAEELNVIKGDIDRINKSISDSCDNESKGSKNKPIRMFSIMVHGQNVTRFNAICKSYFK